ncbi:hypothetical protein [Natronomonas marina]|jgi:hypothetical protein|uniref:hypothetical protein n=1 Tax=Natronomonas marina TaxID=2961939 RepID=UPI0020C970E7|nr:hypothetical protein [Natronomonas marina]
MTPERTALLLTLGVVLVVGIGTGPAVTGVDSPSDSSPSDLHQPFVDDAGMSVDRTAAVEVRRLPTDGTLRRVPGGHRPDVAPLRVAVETASSPVVVEYSVELPAVEYADVRSRRLPAGTTEDISVAAPAATVEAPLDGGASLTGVVTVSLTANGETYVIERESIAVEVTE